MAASTKDSANAVITLVRKSHPAALLKFIVYIVVAQACIGPKSLNAAQGNARNSRDDERVASRHSFRTDGLQFKIRGIASEAHGKVSVACSLPGDAIRCDLYPDAKPPMQSVFKLPLALAVLHQVEQGSLAMDQAVHFGPGDRILPKTYSPLQDRFPEANVDVPLSELLRLTVALSDNVAADLLLRLVGGPKGVTEYVTSLGVDGFHLVDGEHELHRDVMAQYHNWFRPAGAVQLLRRLRDNPPLSLAHVELLLEWMKDSVKSNRLKGELPPGTVVAHKAGTSGVDAGLAHATNDIGLITSPDKRVLAIAVFITDSSADELTRERVISKIARAAYDASLRGVAGEERESSVQRSTLEGFARSVLRDASGRGFIHVRDVDTGEILAHVSGSASGVEDQSLTIDSPIKPLSVVKLYVAASWLDHGFGKTLVHCLASGGRPSRGMLVEDVLASGCDSGGGEMAQTLKREIGAAEVLADLRRYGLEDLALKPDASDAEWASVLSLGEDKVTITPREASAFLREIGRRHGSILSPQTAYSLRAALDEVVQHGTAVGIKNSFGKSRWHIGGKTGTGPGQCGDQCDGWFASLLSEGSRPRYVILVFIRGRGLGGGVAAHTAVVVAKHLISTEPQGR